MAKIRSADVFFEGANIFIHKHSGFGFRGEQDFECKFCATRLYQAGSFSVPLIWAHLSEHVLGLLRSFCGRCLRTLGKDPRLPSRRFA